jgi:hypothetical protein
MTRKTTLIGKKADWTGETFSMQVETFTGKFTIDGLDGEYTLIYDGDRGTYVVTDEQGFEYYGTACDDGTVVAGVLGATRSHENPYIAFAQLMWAVT